MTHKSRLFFMALIATLVLGLTPGLFLNFARAAANGVSLTGAVKSSSGASLGGVTISARAAALPAISTTVFTDEQGNYYFPQLAGGQYDVWAQAVGFETARAPVQLGGSVQHQNFVLKSTQDFVRQLTGQEYITALPEDTPKHRRMKEIFYLNCSACHEPNYILQNRFDEKGWNAIINLMSRIDIPGNFMGKDQPALPAVNYFRKDLAAYLAEMRGPGPSPMQFKPNPRPTGEAARAVITEYNIPWTDKNDFTDEGGYATNDGSDWSLGTPSGLNGGGHNIHDVALDRKGNLWFTMPQASETRTLTKIDAQTGNVTDLKVPAPNGQAMFVHSLIMDSKGIMWFSVIGPGASAGALGRLDPETQKVEIFEPPREIRGGGTTVDVDLKGNVWMTSVRGALRFDAEKRQFQEFRSVTPIGNGLGGTYGITADREGNGWWTQFGLDRINKGDIVTGKSVEIKVPPRVSRADDTITEEDRQFYALAGTDVNHGAFWSQGPRRLDADKNGDFVWVCIYWSDMLAKIDIHTLKTTYYKYPVPGSGTYAAVVDKNHDVWVSLANGDGVAKFEPKTERWTYFPFPSRGGEMRHLIISERDGETEIVAASNRAPKLARLRMRTKEELQALKNEAR